MITVSQLVLTFAVLFIIWRTLLAYKKKNFSKSFTLLWSAFWSGVIFLIFQKEVVSDVAHKLGISRGVDLVIYLSLITIFYFIYRFLGMFYEMDQKITRIVRKIALKDAKKR